MKINDMKARIFASLLAAFLLLLNFASAQPLQITAAALPPFPPQAGTYFDNPARFFNVAITNTSPNNVSFWVGMRIEMTFPDRIVLETPLNMPPYRPLTIGGYQTIVLDQMMFRQLLGHLELHNLLTRGIRLSRFESGEGNLMPEGNYTASITAYEYNPNAGTPILASAPGNTHFTICYSASSPEFITPVACLDLSGDVVEPINPLLISWRPPMFNCAGPPAQFTYNLKMVEVMPGQNIQSAIDFNPVAIQLYNMMASTAQIDTNMFASILRPGQRYAMQVTAMPTAQTSNIIMANQGKSPVCSFVWGSATPVELPPVADVPEEPRPEPEIVHETITECEPGLADNISKQFFSTDNLAGQDITVGHFTVHVQQATRAEDHYQGNGYVTWRPFGSPVNIKVSFADIKINDQLQVYDGEIYSDTIDLVDYVPGYIQKSYGWADAKLDQYKQKYGLNLPTYRAKAQGYYDMLKQPSRKLNQVMGQAPVTLPLAVNAAYDATPVDIGIIGMVFTPSSAKMNTMAVFEVPESDAINSPWLVFVGQGMCFTPDALLFEQQGTLFLAGDFEVNVGGGNQLIFKKASTLGDTSNGTFVQWNTDGFEVAGIDCDLKFSTGYLKADDGNGNIDPAKQVTASFRTQFSDWNDWIATASMEPFQVDGLPEFTFTPSNITYDNSKERNPGAGMVFPAKYAASEKTVAWQGFYIQNLSVQLPKDFTEFGSSSGSRLSVDVSNMLIDDNGVSCNINKTNIVSLTTGNLGGWAFSMDTLALDILKNDFEKARVAGMITVPAIDEDLHYAGFLTTDEQDRLDYAFAIHPEDDIEMGMWLAKLKIDQNSGLDIKKDAHGAAVSLLMNGQINIVNVSHGDIDFSFDSIQFANMGIANRDPVSSEKTFYLDEGTWSFGSPQKKIGPFDFALDSVYFQKKQHTYYGLGLKGKMTIAEVFTGTVSVDVDGEVTLHSGLTAPTTRFSGVSISEITIEGNFSPVTVAGTFGFFKNDPTYGRGVRGIVQATFDPLFDVEALAMFGSVSGYPYWMVDAGVAFNPPIEAFPLAFGGFGGGIRYNMKAEQFANDPADQFGGQKTLLSHSGVRYVPEKDAFGLRAGVTLTLSNGLGGGNILNGTAWIDCGWNGNGFSALRIYGDTYALTDYPGNKNSLFEGPFEMVYDKDNEEVSFWFEPSIEVNFLGAEAKVPINMWANYGTEKWYFTIGSPGVVEDRVQVTLIDWEAGPIKTRLGANAYFALGNALEFELPPIPEKVQRFLNRDNLTARRTNPGSLGRRGMMMGAHLDGSFNFDLLIYCKLEILAGFDLMMVHDPGATCNNKPVGYNGWYGAGQIYSYFGGEVGIHIRLWFFKGRVPFASFAAGALLMGGMPDPFWAYGTLRVKGSVLGGLIKVNRSFEVEIGDVCVPGGGNPLADIKILEEIQPGVTEMKMAADGEPESPFIRPRIIANVDLSDGSDNPNYPFNLYDSDARKLRTYQFFIDSVLLYVGGAGTVTDQNFQANMETLASPFEPTIVNLIHPTREYFEPGKMHKLRVVAAARERRDGQWKWPWIDGKEQKHTEVKEAFFKTGVLPDDFTDQLVFSTPVNGQRFVTKNDGNWGVHLLAARPDIIEETDEYRIEARITRLSQQPLDPWSDQQQQPSGSEIYTKKVPFTTAGDFIGFQVNRAELENEQFYSLSLVKINKGKEHEALEKLARENRRLIVRNLLNNPSYQGVVIQSKSNSTDISGELTATTGTDLSNAIPLALSGSNLLQSTAATSFQTTATPVTTTSTSSTVLSPLAGAETSSLTTANLSTQPLTAPGSSSQPVDLNAQIAAMHREVIEDHVNRCGQDTLLNIRQMAFLQKFTSEYTDTLLNIFFRTSRFNSLSEKIQAFGNVTGPYFKDGKSQTATEPFEKLDLQGYTQSEAIACGYRGALPPLLNFYEEHIPANQYDRGWQEQFYNGIYQINDMLSRVAFKPRPNVSTVNPVGIDLQVRTQYRLQPQFPVYPASARNLNDFWPGSNKEIFMGMNVPSTFLPAPVSLNDLNDATGGVAPNQHIFYNRKTTRQIAEADQKAYIDFKTKLMAKAIEFENLQGSGGTTGGQERDLVTQSWITYNYQIKGYNQPSNDTRIILPAYHIAYLHWYSNRSDNGLSLQQNMDNWNFIKQAPAAILPSNIPNGWITVYPLLWDNQYREFNYSNTGLGQKIAVFWQ